MSCYVWCVNVYYVLHANPVVSEAHAMTTTSKECCKVLWLGEAVGLGPGQNIRMPILKSLFTFLDNAQMILLHCVTLQSHPFLLPFIDFCVHAISLCISPVSIHLPCVSNAHAPVFPLIFYILIPPTLYPSCIFLWPLIYPSTHLVFPPDPSPSPHILYAPIPHPIYFSTQIWPFLFPPHASIPELSLGWVDGYPELNKPFNGSCN